MNNREIQDDDREHLDGVNLHTNLWYDSRAEGAQSMMSPCQSPYTNLTSVPDNALVSFSDGTEMEVDSDSFTELHLNGQRAACFIIERAMLDPDAIVHPRGGE